MLGCPISSGLTIGSAACSSSVFGRRPNGPDLLRAIASYERTQVSFDSPFDHFMAGEKNAIDGRRITRADELLGLAGQRDDVVSNDADPDVVKVVVREVGDVPLVLR